MPSTTVQTYEAMFLFPQTVLGDLQIPVDHITELLHRAGAEMISLSKWDERRLAYEIRGNKRGVFFLVYFRAPGSKMAALERDCNLSEKVLRWMVCRADHLSTETMEASDGRAQLADEIKLRATQPAAGTPTPIEETVPSDADDEDEALSDED